MSVGSPSTDLPRDTGNSSGVVSCLRLVACRQRTRRWLPQQDQTTDPDHGVWNRDTGPRLLAWRQASKRYAKILAWYYNGQGRLYRPRPDVFFPPGRQSTAGDGLQTGYIPGWCDVSGEVGSEPAKLLYESCVQRGCSGSGSGRSGGNRADAENRTTGRFRFGISTITHRSPRQRGSFHVGSASLSRGIIADRACLCGAALDVRRRLGKVTPGDIGSNH